MKTVGNSYIPMILMNTALQPGDVMPYIDALSDEDIRSMALAEFYYFTGRHAENAAITAKYLECENFEMRASAWLMYAFSNITLCRKEETQRSLAHMNEIIHSGMAARLSIEQKALLILAAHAADVLIHLQIAKLPPLNEIISRNL